MPDRIQNNYVDLGLFVGPTPATGAHFTSGNSGVNLVTQLHRIQSHSISNPTPTQGVNEFGFAPYIGKLQTETYTPQFTFTYYPTNGINEYRLGFPIDGATSIASGLFDTNQDSKNYFLLTVAEGTSAAANTDRDNHFVEGIGNGFISNFELSASVGGFLEGNVTIDGSNLTVHAGSSGNNIPAVNPTNGTEITTWQYTIPVASTGESQMPVAIQKGGIVLEGLPGTDLFGAKLSSAHIQSFSATVPFSRELFERLGSKSAFARPLQTPIEGSISLDFNTSELSTGTLESLINNCGNNEYDFNIKLSACDGTTESEHMIILIKGAVVEEQSASIDIGSPRNGSVNFSFPVGTASDTAKGIFLSGSYNNLI